MWKYIKQTVKDLVSSFNTRPEGFSARKLTAFAILTMIIYLHFKFVTASNVVSVIEIDMIFIAILFGIVTVDQLLRFRRTSFNIDDVGKDTSTTTAKDPEVEDIKQDETQSESTETPKQ